MFRQFKNRWNIESNFQLLVIIFVFSITGSGSLWVKKQIFGFIEFDDSLPFALRLILAILIITPIYQVLLILIGALMGQFRFFWAFEKKMIQRFNFNRKTNSIQEQ